MAANIFTGATDSNWGTATNWSLGVVPTATDGHVATFNATSPNCTVNALPRVCNSIDFTYYTNTINMASNITVSGNVKLGIGMNIIGAGSLTVNTSATLTSNGKAWPNNFLTDSNAICTYTLTDNWTILGNTSINSVNLGAGIKNTFNGFELIMKGNVSLMTGGNRHVFGSTKFILQGAGTWLQGVASILFNDLTINPSGVRSINTNLNYGVGTLKYIPGTGTVNAASSTLGIVSNCTLDINGISWGNVSIPSNTIPTTITLNSLLTTLGSLSIGNIDATFAGIAGFSVPTLTLNTAPNVARNITLQSGNTYNINSNFLSTGSNSAVRYTLKSSTPGVRAILTLSPSATQNVIFTNATDIDSSLGKRIYSFNGVFNNTLNWDLLSPDSINSGIFTFAS